MGVRTIDQLPYHYLRYGLTRSREAPRGARGVIATLDSVSPREPRTDNHLPCVRYRQLHAESGNQGGQPTLRNSRSSFSTPETEYEVWRKRVAETVIERRLSLYDCVSELW